MDWSDIAKGCAVFVCVIIMGWLSIAYVDRKFATPPVAETTDPTSTACVSTDGSWKNWPWPNVPALSPKCPPDQK